MSEFRAAGVRALALLDAGCYDEAGTLLAGILPPGEPITAGPNRHLINAAVLYVEATHGDPTAVPSVLAWARYAYHASRHLPGPPDLRLMLTTADALSQALHRVGDHDRAVATVRAAIALADAHGDAGAALDRQLPLAGALHGAGRCAEASSTAVAAITNRYRRHRRYRTLDIDDVITAMQAFLLLETCHRHHAATAVTAPIRLTDLPDTPAMGRLLALATQLAPACREHTQRHHPDEQCPRANCPVRTNPHDTDADAPGRVDPLVVRFITACLYRFDPYEAPPCRPLADAAAWYTTVAEPNPAPLRRMRANRWRPSPLAWAGYVHRTAIHLHGDDLDQVHAANDTYAQALQRHAWPVHIPAAWRDAVRLSDQLGHRDAAALCRLRLATALHTLGRCTAGIQQADTAAEDWLTRHPQISPTSSTLLLHATFLRISCHHHTETRRYPYLRHLHAAHPTTSAVLQLLDDAERAATNHSQTFHPHPCHHEACLLNTNPAAPRRAVRA
ncbi:hypothetical protein AB0K00_42440 [Dactylosporangium sp. NPDC049525]|uniref:hypothetical protein n=1 Tax=Dactylosporangium sp. NPDC049525 TaxID=3154730 RepID=UPI0034388691